MKIHTNIVAILAAVCVGLCSCAPESVEVGDGTERVPVSFVARSVPSEEGGVATRGEVIADAAGLAGGGGFDVWTYCHTGDWATATDAAPLLLNAASVPGGTFDHVHVTSDDGGGSWNYGPYPEFWPEEQRVSSFALAPRDAAGAAVARDDLPGAIPTVSYTLPEPGAERVDLMFAKAAVDLTAGSSGGMIVKSFRHALSKVDFLAFKSRSLADAEVFVTSVKLIDIHESGTAPLTASAASPAAWTATGPEETLLFTIANGRLSVGEITATASASAQALLTDAVGSLFMMPQELSGAQLEITYTIDGEETVKLLPMPLESWDAGRSHALMLGIAPDKFVIAPVIYYDSQPVTLDEAGLYVVEAWGGAGGAGGAGDANVNWRGGAGGAGVKRTAVFRFAANETIRVQVGQRGTPGNSASQSSDGSGPGGTGGSVTYFGAGGRGGRQKLYGANGANGGGGGGGAASGIVVYRNSAWGVWLAAAGGGGGGGGGGTPGQGSAGGAGGTNGGNGESLTFVSYMTAFGGAGGGSDLANGAGSAGTPCLNTNSAGGGGGGGGGWNPSNSRGGGAGGNGTNGWSGSGGGGGGAGASYDTSPDNVPANSFSPLNADAYNEVMALPSPPAQTGGEGNGVVRITYIGP